MIEITELKSWLGNPDGEGVTDLLEALEEAVVEIVQDETGRYFGASEAKTEQLVGLGTRKLHLNENPTAITSVERRQQVGDAFETIVEGDSDGFELRAATTQSGRATLIRKASLVWSTGYEYRVIYNFGYTAGAEPKRIRAAVKDLVAFKYHARGREGLRTFQAGGVQWSQFTSITELDVFQVPGLSRTFRLWRPRKMVLQ